MTTLPLYLARSTSLPSMSFTLKSSALLASGGASPAKHLTEDKTSAVRNRAIMDCMDTIGNLLSNIRSSTFGPRPFFPVLLHCSRNGRCGQLSTRHCAWTATLARVLPHVILNTDGPTSKGRNVTAAEGRCRAVSSQHSPPMITRFLTKTRHQSNAWPVPMFPHVPPELIQFRRTLRGQML